MSAARYEVLSTLPPGSGARSRLAWQTGDVGFRRAVVLREVSAGTEVGPATPAQQGVLPLLDLVELEGKRWAVYEFVPGATFAEVASAHFAVDRLPSLGLIGRVVVDACRAIQRVHGWADPLGLAGPQQHGGLSDASVFIGFDGIARILDLNARRAGKFTAPELSRGGAFDARADVFSLGALLHHATTRFEKSYAATMARAPSPAEFPPPSAVHPEASPALDAVVMRALMPSPGSRFSSAGQLADEIEKVLGPILFTYEQVNAVLVPLFGDRMAALRELVDPKRKVPAPRASAPRKTNNALDAVAALDVGLDGSAAPEIEDLPTQANLAIPAGMFKPGPPVPDFDPHATGPGKAPGLDFDPHATTPGRVLAELAARPSRPSGPKRNVQADAERARAKGQEKISTADLEPDELSPELKSLQGPLDELGSEITNEPTNVKPRLSQAAIAAFVPDEHDGMFEDPKKKEPTMDVDPSEAPEEAGPSPRGKGRGSKLLIGVLALLIIGGGAVVALRPGLIAQLKARLRPPPPPATVEELPFEEVAAAPDAGVSAEVPPPVAAAEATDAGEAEEDSDGGEEEEETAVLAVADAGPQLRDAGKPPAPVHKKKKKKKRSR